MNRFPRGWSEHSFFCFVIDEPSSSMRTIWHPRSRHSCAQKTLTFRPGTSKTCNEMLGDLNEPIWVVIDFSSLSQMTRSRTFGFLVMFLVVPLSRTRLSLRTWQMSLTLWAHVFHGSTEDFSQQWKSPTLIICLFSWGKVIEFSLLIEESYQSVLYAAEGQKFQACSSSSQDRVLSLTWPVLTPYSCGLRWELFSLVRLTARYPCGSCLLIFESQGILTQFLRCHFHEKVFSGFKILP